MTLRVKGKDRGNDNSKSQCGDSGFARMTLSVKGKDKGNDNSRYKYRDSGFARMTINVGGKNKGNGKGNDKDEIRRFFAALRMTA